MREVQDNIVRKMEAKRWRRQLPQIRRLRAGPWRRHVDTKPPWSLRGKRWIPLTSCLVCSCLSRESLAYSLAVQCRSSHSWTEGEGSCRKLEAVLACLLATVTSASHVKPPVVPLIVRNPYLSTWLRAREEPWSQWPIFWTGQSIGMAVMASVPGSKTVYPLLGRTSFDASTTNLTYRIPAPSSKLDDANLTISFLSPITPASSLRQSIPASYVGITAEGSFDIDIYMDINGDWVSGDANSDIQWFLRDAQSESGQSLRSWEIQRQEEQAFTEHDDRAEWGRLLFTAPADTHYQSGSAEHVRRSFARSSGLHNTVDSGFRAINDDEPVFAFHKTLHLGSANSSHPHPHALFTLTHIQDEVVQFASSRGLTLMRPLWRSFFLTDTALLKFHFADVHNAVKLSKQYTTQLEADAHKAGGSDYVDIVTLSARQVLGATSFSGTPDNPLVFLKEISSNGNTQTVDVIFPAWPFFSYTNPRWLAYLLEPLLEHQLSGQYPNKYSMHDLGAHFPNLTGHADGNDEYMPVEECGDMLIMGLSLVKSLQYGTKSAAQSLWSTLGVSEVPSPDTKPFALQVNQESGDMFGMDNQWGGAENGKRQAKQWLEANYPIWKQWTEYLIEESLEPKNQLCTDDFAGWLPLQTNLALKGIVGIKAMSELATVVDRSKEAKYYRNISETYISKWQDVDHGISKDHSHAKLAYNWYGSWTTLYSLFADAVLCFHAPTSSPSLTRVTIEEHYAYGNPDQKPIHGGPKHNSTVKPFIPSAIYANQSTLYGLSMQKFGLPLDSRHLYAKSDWMIQVAAVSSPKIKQTIITKMAYWLNETNSDLPFTDLYDTEGDGGFGAGNRFTARPVVGSHFSLLALERACGGDSWEGPDGIEW
ncbi:hypothetical protein FH972_022656 [Carpinus fangiana]|uniref:Glutaminase n=1 Tax=Carpinus fangiana TaxID=176857 RepID=A0A5N6KT71_9ROSI|nr:hypothetical protein FH972_022656 [Carpinus fangiana]